MNEYKEINELPEEIDRVIMILDDVEEIVTECTDERDSQRWFCGENMGAYPINEIKYWKDL